MIRFEALPEALTLFPLSGALLLPRGRLPLNIFEPRYLTMIEEALSTPHRLIGMIQPAIPLQSGKPSRSVKKEPPLHLLPTSGDKPSAPLCPIGCAGRITSFSETEDGRYVITLTGICRFAIAEELPLQRNCRRIRPRWDSFLSDLHEETVEGFDRNRLLTALRSFLRLHGIASDWDLIERTPDDRLISSLAMICPFSPGEKQALLESVNLSDRASTMVALIETIVSNSPGPSSPHDPYGKDEYE